MSLTHPVFCYVTEASTLQWCHVSGRHQYSHLYLILVLIAVFSGCAKQTSEPTMEQFDLDRFSESVKSLKQKSAGTRNGYWTRDADVNWQIANNEREVLFPSDATTITDGSGTYFQTEVFLHSRDMTHGEAKSLGVNLAKLLGASEEQLEQLEAWPKVAESALAHVIEVSIRSENRTYTIKIRDAFDNRLPARVLVRLYDTANTSLPKLKSD